jgi:hypothetical protein
MNPLFITGIFQAGQKLLDHFFPDPAKKAEAQLELLRMHQTGELAQLTADTELAKGQLAINLEEAKSPNVFIAGGRPFIIWVCGFAFVYNYILQPLLLFFVFAFGTAEMVKQMSLLPDLEMAEMMPPLLGLLGLGYYRTREKMSGTEANR